MWLLLCLMPEDEGLKSALLLNLRAYSSGGWQGLVPRPQVQAAGTAGFWFVAKAFTTKGLISLLAMLAGHISRQAPGGRISGPFCRIWVLCWAGLPAD